MSWTLGDVTLPAPQGYERRQVQIQTDVTTLSGSTRRDVTRKKEAHVLYFEKLTQAEVASIVTEYNTNSSRSFSVSETNLTLSARDVLISMQRRRYNTPGDEYREDIVLELQEV